MKIAIVLGLMTFAVVNAMNLINSHEINEQEWTLFKSQFNKLYEDEREEVFRKNVYFENKLRIAKHNILYKRGQKSYSMGINQFGDLMPNEFVAKIGCLRMNDIKQNYTSTFKKSVKNLPDYVDWRENNYVTDVKDQGSCGSCWAFSATGALEGQYAGKYEVLQVLSEQNLIDCASSEGNHGCKGGWMDYAYQYIEDNGGIESEEEYPYEGKVKSCRYNGDAVAEVRGIKSVTSKDEKALMEAVSTVGPVSVGIDVTQSFQAYEYGVYYEEHCSSTRLNHAVLVVGYGTDASGGDYWIVKNSWGKRWGIDGYIWMARNRDNNCGIATAASYPLV